MAWNVLDTAGVKMLASLYLICYDLDVYLPQAGTYTIQIVSNGAVGGPYDIGSTWRPH